MSVILFSTEFNPFHNYISLFSLSDTPLLISSKMNIPAHLQDYIELLTLKLIMNPNTQNPKMIRQQINESAMDNFI